MMVDLKYLVLALFDGLPPLLFLIGTIYLSRVIKYHLNKDAYAIFCAGSIVCFIGGIYKWIGKIIFVVYNVEIIELNETLFLFIAPGYLFLSIGMLLANLKFKNKNSSVFNSITTLPLPVLPFIISVFVFTLVFYINLFSYLIKINKKKYLLPYFITFVLTCSMSFISKVFISMPNIGDFTANAAAQIINTINYLIFYYVSYLLQKSYKKEELS